MEGFSHMLAPARSGGMAMKERIQFVPHADRLGASTPVRSRLLQRSCACGASPGLDGECANCRGTKLGRSVRSTETTWSPAPPIVHEVLQSPGSPLDPVTRAFMEPRFNHDFAGVRVHTGTKAAESARAVDALAYTVGPDIVFGSGHYGLGSMEGRRLLAHELTHVVQQDGRGQDPSTNLAVGPANSGGENEADDAARRVARGEHATTITVGNAGWVQRDIAPNPPPAPPTPPAPVSACGPDATDWFVQQVDKAKRDPVVLAIQANLAGAHRVAARFGFSAERVAEGGVAKRVLAEETRAGSPARTPEATAQVAASAPGQAEFGRAVAAATAPLPFVGAPEQIVLLSIRRAAAAWKDLVGTGKRYDFKNDPATMKGPRSAHCPVQCNNTITLCPSTISDCFLTDVPGNLFYAHLGRFIGWTELSLQLGSEFAQLESTKTWDPPEDTRMISVGFALPDPLGRSDLCAAIGANRSIFNLAPCANCSEPTTATLV
jgi:hypothetical protein